MGGRRRGEDQVGAALSHISLTHQLSQHLTNELTKWFRADSDQRQTFNIHSAPSSSRGIIVHISGPLE